MPYTADMEALKRYFEANAISQAEFARQLDVSQPTVSDWINGKISPSTDNLRAIAVKTGLSLESLLDIPKRKRGLRHAPTTVRN